MKTLALTDICKPKQWKTISGKNLLDSGYPVYGANGKIGYWNEYNHEDETLTIACRGTCGAVNIVEPKSYINGNAMCLDNLSEDVRLKYLFYYLKHYDFKDIITGTSIPQITVQGLSKLLVSIPEIKTQDTIVAKLDEITEIISLRTRQLSKLDNLVKAQFVEMFGEIDLSPQKDTWVQISKIGDVVGGSTPKTNIAEYWNGDLRWLTPAEIVSGSGYIYDSKRKITKAGVDSCSLQELPRDTVILSSRAPIGKVTIAGTTFYCNQGFKNIICSDKILPVYLYSLLLYNTDYLNSLGRGATFKEISKKVVEQIRIPVPSIALQSGFATFVSQVDKSKFAISCDILSMRNFYIRLINNCVVHRSVDL